MSTHNSRIPGRLAGLGLASVGVAAAVWAHGAGAPGAVVALIVAGAGLLAVAVASIAGRAPVAAANDQGAGLVFELATLRASLVETVAGRLDGVVERLDAQAAERQALDSAGRLAELAGRLDALLAARRDTEVHHLRQLDELARSLSGRIDGDLEVRQRADQERLQALDRAATALRERADGDLDQRRALTEELTTTLREHLAEVSARLDDRWSDATAELGRTLDQVAARDADRASAFAEATAGIGDQLAGAALAVRSRADEDGVAAAERDLRLAEGMEALVATAAALREAALAQGQAASELTESADRRAEAVADRSAEHAAAFARQMIQACERIEERMEGFERSLLEMHRAAFAAAGAELRDHTREITDTVEQTVSAANGASDAVRAGSGELGAAAEMFAEAVERHRDAANLWLESLGTVEGAIDRAGEHAASDFLEQQLAQARELFGQQLELHRELYEQMRAARPTAPSSSEDERASA